MTLATLTKGASLGNIRELERQARAARRNGLHKNEARRRLCFTKGWCD